jgi:hypothetical protein
MQRAKGRGGQPGFCNAPAVLHHFVVIVLFHPAFLTKAGDEASEVHSQKHGRFFSGIAFSDLINDSIKTRWHGPK